MAKFHAKEFVLITDNGLLHKSTLYPMLEIVSIDYPNYKFKVPKDNITYVGNIELIDKYYYSVGDNLAWLEVLYGPFKTE